MWDDSLTYTLDPSLVILILCESAIPTPMHAASLSHTVHQLSIVDDDVTYVHLEHISRSECIIWSNILYLFSVLFILECWYNAVFVYKVPFVPWVIWYNHRLRFKYCSTYVINSIIIYTIFVSLLPKTSRIACMIGVYMEWSPKQHPSIHHVLNTHHRRCDRDKTKWCC